MRVVGFRMDRAILGIDAGPAAFSFQRAMRRLKSRFVRACADAMRHLIEPVAQRLGSDLDRLKQNVVFWIARHTLTPLLRYSLYAKFIARGRTALRRGAPASHSKYHACNCSANYLRAV